MDFFFGFEPYARKLTDFLQTMVPMRFNTSKKLISHDGKSNTYNYKYVFRWAFAHFYLYLDTALKTESISSRWVSVVEFYDPTLGIGKVFGQESTVVKWNYQIFGLHEVTVHQKLDVILVIKWFKNWSQQKMLFPKKVRVNWYSSMIFFFRKIQMIFDVENSLWKSKIGTFWQTVTRWRLKIW